MKRALRLSISLLLWLCGIRAGPAQTVVASTNPARRGSGDLSISFQSYYNRVNGTAAANVRGAAVSLRHFFPRTGLFTLQLEPVTSGGDFALGENFVQWSGLPWANRHWDLVAGDFRSPTAMVENPIPNLSQPEISLRGARVIARTGNWDYSVYGGLETLSRGSRVPFRTRVPQAALGGEAAGKVGQNVELAFRYLHLSSSPGRVRDQRLFFPVNRQFTRSHSLISQASVKISEALSWYTEAGWSSVAQDGELGGGRSELSIATGPALHTARVAIRANYLNQGTGYLPLLGYYLGDRRGANVDGVWYLGMLSLNGNWGQARNNRERNPEVPDYYSRQGGGGFQLRLPSNFFFSGSISKLRFETRSEESGLLRNENRQFQINVSRPLFRHNLHATWQRIDSEIRDTPQRLQFLELEDNYTWRRFSAGAAVRWQRFSADELRQSLYLRASGQYQMRHFSVYGYWEQGKDLASATMLSTQISSTSVFGLTWQAPGALSLRMEAFRNRLNAVLNPENLFVLGTRGIAPDSILSRADDWSLFLRVSREFSWGEPGTLGSGGLLQPEAPLTGAIAGYVRLQTIRGEAGAPDVWLLTDTGQSVKTDSSGYFRVPDVPQGARIVKLDLDRLPADYNPPAAEELSTEVRSGQLSRIDLQVTPLAAIEGTVVGEDGSPAGEGIVVRLSPDDRSTSTDVDGRFGFYNLPEGDYEIRLEESSLPENARLISPASLPAAPRYGKDEAPLEFRYQIVLPGPKPVKQVFTEHQSSPLDSPAKQGSTKRSKGRVIVKTTAQNISARPAHLKAPRTGKWVAR